MVRLYQSGVGTPALCEGFGISKPTALALLHERGVAMRRQPLTSEQRAEAVQLYGEGLAIKPIAAQLGSSFGAVHRVLKAEGVSLRARRGRYNLPAASEAPDLDSSIRVTVPRDAHG